MVPDLTLKITRNIFPRLATNLTPALDRTLRKAADDLVGIMVARQQGVGFWDTGATGESTEVKLEESRPFLKVIGPRTDYAQYGEFGTTFRAARPWMRPALEIHTPTTLKALEAEADRQARQR